MNRSPVPAWLLRVALCAASAACALSASAQDAPPPAEPTPAPGAEAAPADPNEAIERVVSHIEALTKIIEANAEQPDKAIADFEAYLTQNAQAMRDANAAIEAKLKSLPADESQSYQEGMQRRLEDPLRKFMTAMLNFGRKHPDKAKALDEKLQRASL